MLKEEKIIDISILIILYLSSLENINTSYRFRKIFSIHLGILIDESVIIENLIEKGMLKSDGLINHLSINPYRVQRRGRNIIMIIFIK